MATRTLVVWCPDWPVVAAGIAPDVPAAVLVANRVVVCSAAARAEGVRRGLRRREAQARCPRLEIVGDDPARDARAFEAVVTAVEASAPLVEVLRPGLLALATRGPSRWFGGDEALAAHLAQVAGRASPGKVDARAGVAAGTFAATLAARDACVVARGRTPAFLAPKPVGLLDQSGGLGPRSFELTDLLRRLGIHTLGDLAALPAADVGARFGPDGLRAHRLAAGHGQRGVVARTPPPDLTAQTELDPPADDLDRAAFAAKALADDLDARLARAGLACTLLTIKAQTEHGESLTRSWRHDGPLSPVAIAERMRWQLDGWLTRQGPGSIGALTLLRLVPAEVVPAGGDQHRLWDSPTGQPERVGRALARVQAMLGQDAVLTAARRGGRDPGDQMVLRAWDGVVPPDDTDRGRTVEGPAPWPGRMPAPHPATVFAEPLPAALLDGDGQVVGVTGRRALSAVPCQIRVSDRTPVAVVGWSGPWPADERWWCPTGRRRARFQVAAADGRAWLVALEHGSWRVEATYD